LMRNVISLPFSLIDMDLKVPVDEFQFT
jgi:hypothetical protein